MVVHHRDGDKANNNLSNLEIMSRKDHRKLHGKELWESKKKAMKEGHQKKYAETDEREKQRRRMKILWAEGKLGPRKKACSIEGCQSLADARGLCGVHYQRFRRAGTLVQRTATQNNHRILSIIRRKVDELVYDLTVPGLENFALASGVFVHNSKDCADAVCGVVYGLHMRTELWVQHGIMPHQIPQSLSDMMEKDKNRKAALKQGKESEAVWGLIGTDG